MTAREQRTALIGVCRAIAFAVMWTAAKAGAAQFVDVRDGDSAIVKLPVKDQTRIKVQGGVIVKVYGDVWDNEKNPGGRIAVLTDEAAGEIYVQPVSQGGAMRPIKLDIKTDLGTFALLMQPLDMPGDTIIMVPKGKARQRGMEQAKTGQDSPSANAEVIRSDASEKKAGSFVRSIKGWMLAMAMGEAPRDVEVREVRKEIALWKEVRFQLDDQWMGREWVGERYTLVNKAAERLVLDEREFYRKGVLAVTVSKHSVDPGSATAVWVLRQRDQGE